MLSTCFRSVAAVAVLATVISIGSSVGSAQNAPKAGASATIGYAAKKPIVGAACPTCPWGAMAEVVKAAMKPYGWDIQICYSCAGGPREARLVSKAAIAPPPANPTPNDPPLPKGPIDFGITGTEFLRWAYDGTNDFSKDPGTPQKQLRAIAKIHEPTYYVIAVRADTGIKNLSEIVEKKMPVKMAAATDIGGSTTSVVLDYFGISEEKIKSFGGTWATGFERGKDQNVFMGFGALTNPPEYQMWYQASQKYDLKYLELPADLKAKLIKQFGYKEANIPLNAFRGVDKPIPSLVRDGTVIYGREDMPDDFAYTLAKAMDDHQNLLQYGNSSMNWSYDYHDVWQALGVPLHPGAARYYKEKGYMK